MCCDIKCQCPQANQQNSRRCLCCCIPVSIVLSVVSLIIAALATVLLAAAFIPFLTTVLNLASVVTLDIQRVEGASTGCASLPLSATEKQYSVSWQPIAKFNFPGYQAGCDCGTSQTAGSAACSGSCQSVVEMANNTYSTWGSSTGSYTLCKKLFGTQGKSGATFLNNYIKSNGDCKNKDNGYNVQCNTGSDVVYQYCVPNADLCPVNSIVSAPPLTTNLVGESPYTQTLATPNLLSANPNQGYTRLALTQFYTSKNLKNVSPIAEYLITRGAKVCKDFWQINENMQSNVLLQEKSDGCQGSYHSVFNKNIIDQIPARAFLKNNEPKLVDVPGYYPISDSEMMTLSYRPFVLWKMECRDNTFDDVVKLTFDSIAILTGLLNGLYLSIGSAAIAFIGIFALICEWCRNEKQNPYKVRCNCGFGVYCSCCLCVKRCCKKKKVQHHCLDYIQLIDPLVFLFIFAHAVTGLLQFILYIAGFASINSVKGAISDLASKQCSDDENNKNISDLGDAMESAGSTIIGPIAISLLHFIVIMIAYIYLWRGIVKRRREAFQKIQQARINASFNNSYASVNQDRVEIMGNAKVLPVFGQEMSMFNNTTPGTSMYVPQNQQFYQQNQMR